MTYAAKCPVCGRMRMCVRRGKKDVTHTVVDDDAVVGYSIRPHRDGTTECAGSGTFPPEEALVEALP